MKTIHIITLILIAVYALYPLMLILMRKEKYRGGLEKDDSDEVSFVYLSHNGKDFLEKKISYLLQALQSFQKWELIIIDDNSSDGSRELLKSFKGIEGVKLIQKTEQKGIPNSMNLAVKYAQFNHVIFCDQRQVILGGKMSLKKLVYPLRYKNVGAVSACISHIDKKGKFSLLRKHENFIKTLESRNGNLIGVYGPLYAIKKEVYSNLPENIILDDLYLSLKILKGKRIELLNSVKILDDNFSTLYDYIRVKRYLEGFIQILQDGSLMRGLSRKQITMLLWHKYVRLFIPLLLLMSYVGSAIMMFHGAEYLIFFSLITTLGLLSFIPCKFKLQFKLKNFVRINLLYVFATTDILFSKVFFANKSHVNT